MASGEDFEEFCNLDELDETGRVVGKLGSGRNIAVVKHRGKYYAIDSICYHAGGPLYQGDIEDVEGKQCILCPWHKYFVDLDTGEGLYEQTPGVWGSKGVRQRVHDIKVINGKVMIKEDSGQDGSKVTSDNYAYSDDIVARQLRNGAGGKKILQKKGAVAVGTAIKQHVHSGMHQPISGRLRPPPSRPGSFPRPPPSQRE
uniref:Rieske domain-containing protein n=1 Tax=Palpitomonas bilix TaxID=652834 RepID=A0A7S3DF21_9EUKA|mmetsp:Transcript_34880/g.90364  ORF Transcript_34880/g.90364 Transcript_34880/m.90364 type:complete len:200 (+) Transcript_34880:339-938(+)